MNRHVNFIFFLIRVWNYICVCVCVYALAWLFRQVWLHSLTNLHELKYFTRNPVIMSTIWNQLILYLVKIFCGLLFKVKESVNRCGIFCLTRQNSVRFAELSKRFAHPSSSTIDSNSIVLVLSLLGKKMEKWFFS